MAFTVTQLITEAYYLSGRLSQGLQTISWQQLNNGLSLLNSVLAVKSVNERLIPYFNSYSFSAVVNQEKYFIPGMVFCETLTFNYQNVRYSMQPMGRVEYHGSARVNNIQSLMFNYEVERCLNGSNLFMYFLPDQTYPCTVWGKFSLSSVVLNQDLELTLDDFYIEYLRYALAEYICQDNNITFQPQNAAQLEIYEKQFMDISAPDLRIQKASGLVGKQPSMWGMANLSHGWVPY